MKHVWLVFTMVKGNRHYTLSEVMATKKLAQDTVKMFKRHWPDDEYLIQKTEVSRYV